jgi:4a-hydroxytetrahydrobiopterin dehydratase
MTDLSREKCVACKGGVDPLAGEELATYASYVPDWTVVDEHHLNRKFKFRNFVDALAFVNQIGQVAEELGHHPNIFLSWGSVEVGVYTHKIDGLHANDFILAAHIDKLPEAQAG